MGWRVIVAGGRALEVSSDRVLAVSKCLRELGATEVFSGAAGGGDEIGEMAALALGLPVRKFIPEWEKHGKRAGPLRNIEMADEADAVILMPGGAGTASMKKAALSKGLAIVELP